jgi:hypothetical protein
MGEQPIVIILGNGQRVFPCPFHGDLRCVWDSEGSHFADLTLWEGEAFGRKFLTELQGFHAKCFACIQLVACP